MMKITPIRVATVLLLAFGLTACGGWDDTTTTFTATPSSVACDTRQFDTPTDIDEPTSAELATFAKTYTAGAIAVILSPTGGCPSMAWLSISRARVTSRATT